VIQLRHFCLTLIPFIFFAIAACAPSEPIRIGFIGDLSGRGNDLGIAGLNGVRLAVAFQNKAGGINGRQIILFEADDRQDPKTAQQAIKRLIDRKVEAIVGPMTSTIAVATVPLVNEAKLLMVSPTVTTNALSHADDYFFRVLPSTQTFVSSHVEYLLNTRGLKRVRFIYDEGNRAYAESWIQDFSNQFSAAGGQPLPPIGFSLRDEHEMQKQAEAALRDAPDVIYLLTNSVDAAVLCRIIRQLNPSILLGTSEWAATERLTQLGGASVEGLISAQFHDRLNKSPAYVAFRQAYIKRFHQEPGFAGAFAFDAANVILETLKDVRPGESVKRALLSRRTFNGVQNAIIFDAYGDSQGRTFMTRVKSGAFVPISTAP